MECTEAAEFISAKTISKIDTDRNKTPQSKYVKKTSQCYSEEGILENITHYQDSFVHGTGELQSTAHGHISICDGFGCNRKAAAEITVKAGEIGVINLNLCENCIPKFKESTKIAEKHLRNHDTRSLSKT